MPEESARKNPRRIGNYELLDKVGQGGMSTVYKARDVRSAAIVAVKVAARIVMSDPHLSRRFEMEYALVQPLSHKHLVKVLEYGKHEQIPYLVMEYVDGPSLAGHLRTHKQLGELDALAIILPIADALTYLHQKQIIHRDIKPGNILLTTDGQAKLADLGLIKDLESLTQLTRSNMGLGTMSFAAPEQFDDARTADARSDVYSLAATLYVMLTGEHPFGKGPVMNVLQRKMLSKFEAPIDKAPSLRPSVDAAIRLGLHADRERRPASVKEFTAILTGEKKLRASQELPGAVTGPKTKAAKKSAQDRRGGVRYSVALDANCRPVAGAVSQRWTGTITDLSTTGVCLRVKRRFEAGSVLEISFALDADDSSVNQLARVRWLKDTETKAWLLGCEFVNALPLAELESFFAAGMDRTKVE